MLMKKVFTLCLLMLATAWAMAQDSNTFQFVDKDGHVVADGTTIKVLNVETDDFGDIMIPSGLFVKNTTETASSLRIHYHIQTLESGTFQICFPINCITKSTTGTFETGSELMNGNETRNLNTEWIPVTYGKCIVTYQIEVMNQTSFLPPQYESVAMGPMITVEYNYADPAGIEQTKNGLGTAVSYYNINGIQLQSPPKGLNIVKLTNGKVKKLINR